MSRSSVTGGCAGVSSRSEMSTCQMLDDDELVQDGQGEVQGGARVGVVGAALLRPHQHDAGPVWKSILEKM